MDQRKIVLVTGFQGIDHYNNYTTLGRGGSDTTAVALAAALRADACEIYTDVEGIEHHLSWNSIDRIADLVQLIEEEPDVALKLERMKSQSNL